MHYSVCPDIFPIGVKLIRQAVHHDNLLMRPFRIDTGWMLLVDDIYDGLKDTVHLQLKINVKT